MAELTWLPYDVEQWDRMVREHRLSLADEGALMRLVRGSMLSTTAPCTIADDPDEFARILGAQWKKALPVIRAHFTPLSDDPRRLRWGWLYDLYLRQLEKHISYQQRGKKGGRPKAEENAQVEAELSDAMGETESSTSKNRKLSLPETEAQLSQSSTEGISSAPSEHRANTPATGNAPAPGGARDAAATGDYLDRPSVRDELLKRGVRVPERLELDMPASPAPVDGDAYGRVLDEAANAWMEEHPSDTRAIGKQCRRDQHLPLSGELTLMQTQNLRAAVVEEIRRRCGWATQRSWRGEAFTIATETPCAS